MNHSFRELSQDELDLVSGGGDPRVYQEENQKVYFVTTFSSWFGAAGMGGSGGYGSEGAPPEAPPSTHYRMTGRTWCPTDMDAFNVTIHALERQSDTFSTALYTATSQGRLTGFELTYRPEHSRSDYGRVDGYDPDTKTVMWDPFSGASGTNPDGSTWANSAVMTLAHEVAHAAYGGNEAKVIEISNTIAAEWNKFNRYDNPGSEMYRESTNRKSHNGDLFDVSRPNEHSWGIRPDCAN